MESLNELFGDLLLVKTRMESHKQHRKNNQREGSNTAGGPRLTMQQSLSNKEIKEWRDAPYTAISSSRALPFIRSKKHLQTKRAIPTASAKTSLDSLLEKKKRQEKEDCIPFLANLLLQNMQVKIQVSWVRSESQEEEMTKKQGNVMRLQGKVSGVVLEAQQKNNRDWMTEKEHWEYQWFLRDSFERRRAGLTITTSKDETGL